MTPHKQQNNRKTTLLSALFVTTLASNAMADIFHVDDDLMDYPSAGFTSIQDAVDSSAAGDTIYIYTGTYTGAGDEVVHVDSIELELIGVGDVVVDGQNQRRCFRLQGPEKGLTQIRLENLTLVNGEAVSSSGSGWAGNGGGLHAEGEVELHGCTVKDCHSDQNGGGVALSAPNGATFYYTQLSLFDCNVQYCSANGDGGGIYNREAELILETSSVLNNYAFGNGGGIAARQVATPWGSCLVEGLVSGNRAEKNGGGIYSNAMGVQVLGEVSENKAHMDGDGGGIYIKNSYLFLVDLLVVNNEAEKAAGSSKGNGGGIYARNSDIESSVGSSMSGLTFYGNGAHGDGGAFFAKNCRIVTLWNAVFESNGAYGKGGAVTVDSCAQLKIDTASFLYNVGGVAGALYIKNAGGGQIIDNVDMRYNIGIMGGGMNGAALVASGSGTTVEISACNFWQNTKKHIKALQGATLIDLWGNGVNP